MHGIVIASVQVKNKKRRARFFYETFLGVDTRMEMVLENALLHSQ